MLFFVEFRSRTFSSLIRSTLSSILTTVKQPSKGLLGKVLHLRFKTFIPAKVRNGASEEMSSYPKVFSLPRPLQEENVGRRIRFVRFHLSCWCYIRNRKHDYFCLISNLSFSSQKLTPYRVMHLKALVSYFQVSS